MINLIPAAPGTFIIECEINGLILTPVVAWQHVQGNIVYPVTVMPHGGLTHGKAIQHPDGYVSDPTHGLVFENSSAWAAFIKTVKPKDSPGDGRLDLGGSTPISTKAKAETQQVAVIFGTKTYKSKSYWAYSGLLDGIFEIEGDTPYPNDAHCSKITRDEFAALKKQGTPVVEPVVFDPDADDEDDISELV